MLFPTRPRDVYDQSEQHSDEDRLQDKLPSIDVAGHDEERSVGIARKPEKTASAFRLSDLAIKYSVYRESQTHPAGRIAFGELWESGTAIDAATTDLHRIAGRRCLLRKDIGEHRWICSDLKF
jgi:hypothetical protein